MLKLVLAFAILALGDQVFCSNIEVAKNNTRQGCPYPFVSQNNGYSFNYCYYYAGNTKSFTTAFQKCQQTVNSGLVTPKFSTGLEDLYKLYKAFPNYYFWV